MISRQEVASRLCLLKSAVGRMLDANAHYPNDCFCGVGGMNPPGSHLCSYPMTHFDHGHAVEWIEREIVRALSRTKEGRKAVYQYRKDKKALMPAVKEVEDVERTSRTVVFLDFKEPRISCRYCGNMSATIPHTCKESEAFWAGAKKHQADKDAGKCPCVLPCHKCGATKRGEYSHSNGCEKCGERAPS